MGLIIYFFAVLVLGAGLFMVLTNDNYLRKIIGLGIFQSSVLSFYVALGKISTGIPPIDICAKLTNCPYTFSSPLPQVLMLTAIVVGFATMSVALALMYQIYKEYNTLLESNINKIEAN